MPTGLPLPYLEPPPDARPQLPALPRFSARAAPRGVLLRARAPRGAVQAVAVVALAMWILLAVAPATGLGCLGVILGLLLALRSLSWARGGASPLVRRVRRTLLAESGPFPVGVDRVLEVDGRAVPPGDVLRVATTWHARVGRDGGPVQHCWIYVVTRRAAFAVDRCTGRPEGETAAAALAAALGVEVADLGSELPPAAARADVFDALLVGGALALGLEGALLLGRPGPAPALWAVLFGGLQALWAWLGGRIARGTHRAGMDALARALGVEAG